MQRVSIYNKGITGEQKSLDFSASFNAYRLVVSDIFATLHNVRTYYSVRFFSFLLRAREAWCNHSLQRDSQRISLQAFSCPTGYGAKRRIV